MSSQNGEDPGGIHISESSFYGNQDSTHGNGKVTGANSVQVVPDDNIYDDASWEIPGDEFTIYSDAVSGVHLSAEDDKDIYSDAWSERPKLKPKPNGNNFPDQTRPHKDIMATEMPETSEISFSNSQLNPGAVSGTSTYIPDHSVSHCPTKEMTAEDPLLQSTSSTSDTSRIYDDVPSKESSLECFTESLSDQRRTKSGRELSDKDSEFVSYTQSLPPNFSLSGRKIERSLTEEIEEDRSERVQTAKVKSLTLKRTPSVDNTPDKSKASGKGAIFQSQDRNGISDEDENIYESVLLQPSPDNDEYDSDDISWSSDEFESYEDSIHNEAAVSEVNPTPVIIGPPASRVHKIHVAQGLEEPQYPSLLRRLKESFRGTGDLSSGDEDSPCLPVEICDIKHPPPVLPPLPSGLSSNQVKRRHAIGVLIDSEKSYISSLQRLLDDFRQPLLEIPFLQRGKVRVELVKAKEILQYHRMFQIELAEQVKLWHTTEKIGDVFTASFSKSIVLDAYSEYVNSFTAAMEDIKKATRQRAALRDYMKMKEMSSKDRLGLFGLMVKPVQRFPQFITCLQDLLKYTPHDHHDRLGLQRALTELENVAHKLNERKRESEQKLEAKAMLANFKENLITKTGYEQNRKMIRVDDLDQVVEASNKFKKRRLILLDDILILTTVIPSRDGFEPERYKLKWCYPLKEVELKDSSLSSRMQSSVRGEPGKMTVVIAKPETADEDPFNLVTDLTELHHDYSVLSNVVGLVSSLKRSYTGLSEESVLALIRDLQRIIHVKDEQLRLVKSCSITLAVPNRTIAGGIGRSKYVFHTQSPSARQDWCLDLQIAKMALEARNNPGWNVPHLVNGVVNQMPALFIKALPVDVVRHYTKVRCAVPVFLSTPSNIGVGMQHLWVCNTTETRGQVSIVSIHSDRPRVIESYQACDCQILCVENVPGYSAVDDPYSFNTDTVWMVTVKAEVLIYHLTCTDGLTKRQPSATFSLPSGCSCLKYIDDRVFAALDNGQLAIYTRNVAGTWNVNSPVRLSLGTKPVKCLFPLENHLLCTSGNVVHFVNITSHQVEKSHKLSSEDDAVIGHVTRAGVGLWVSYDDQPLIHVYHLETLNQLQDVNVSSAVQKALTGKVPEDVLSKLSKDIQVTCLLASKGLLWVGTSTGIILTLPLPRLREGVPQIGSRPCVSFHGQYGPIRFLLPIFFLSPEVNTLKTKAALREYDYVPFKPSVQKTATTEIASSETQPAEEINKASSLEQVNVGTTGASNAESSSVNDVSPRNRETESRQKVTDDRLHQDATDQHAEDENEASFDSNDPIYSSLEVSQGETPSRLGSELSALNLPPRVARRKDFWQSTPNLAADMEGTEDISILYGSLMKGLDDIHEPYGLRRGMHSKQRPIGKSQTLHTSRSVSMYDSQDSKKNKLRKYKRSRKRTDSLPKERDLARVDEVAAQENSVIDNLAAQETSSLSSRSSQDPSSKASTLSLSSDGKESGENVPKPSDKKSDSDDQSPIIPDNSTPAVDLPTSSQGRDQSWETTLSRKPVNACKSVIVVSGGDGYCNWNKPESNKAQKSEEATLLLWLHKVSS